MTSTSSTTAAEPTTKKGALKGAVAAAAGFVVLMGGAGSFALWNANSAIGAGTTTTGSLSATFGDTSWQDTTPGASNAIDDINSFNMVPGDTVVGTTDVDVTAVGENLVVDTSLDYADGTLPADVTATVVLTDSEGNEVTQLDGSNGGTDYDLDANVTLAFDEDATGSMTQDIDLSKISVDLQQVAPSAGA